MVAEAHQYSRQLAHNMPWSIVKKLEDQRSYPRVTLNIPVKFRNADGHRCAGQLINISSDGVQVRCNVSAAQILHPGGGKICPHNAPMVQLTMDLPVGGESKRLVLGASLVYASTRDEEPRCVLGLSFLELRPLASKTMEQFFCRQLEPDDQIQRRVAAR